VALNDDLKVFQRSTIVHMPGDPRMLPDDRGSCKGPHQTAAGLWYASGTASRADLTAGQRAPVKVPGERTSLKERAGVKRVSACSFAAADRLQGMAD
jgi:hypothetical protein